MINKHTDTSLPAILAHIERELLRGDIITLTRGQWQTLQGEIERKDGRDAAQAR